MPTRCVHAGMQRRMKVEGYKPVRSWVGDRLLEAVEKIDRNGSEQTADHDQQPIRPLLALRIVVVAPAGLRVLNIVGLHRPTVAQAYVRSLCPSLLAPAAAQGQT